MMVVLDTEIRSIGLSMYMYLVFLVTTSHATSDVTTMQKSSSNTRNNIKIISKQAGDFVRPAQFRLK